MCSWSPDLNLESQRMHVRNVQKLWHDDLEEVDEDVGGGIDDEQEVADRSEQGGPDRIGKGGGRTMSLKTQFSQLAIFAPQRPGGRVHRR